MYSRIRLYYLISVRFFFNVGKFSLIKLFCLSSRSLIPPFNISDQPAEHDDIELDIFVYISWFCKQFYMLLIKMIDYEQNTLRYVIFFDLLDLAYLTNYLVDQKVLHPKISNGRSSAPIILLKSWDRGPWHFSWVLLMYCGLDVVTYNFITTLI